MHKLTLFLGILPALALAHRPSPLFALRRTDGTGEAQSCEELGMKECGTGCILLDFECCPGEQGGCPSDKRCVTGDDGKPGCCLKGYDCGGNGGIATTTFSVGGTATVANPDPASTSEAGGEPPASTSDDAAASTSADGAATSATDAAGQSTADAAQSSATDAATGTDAAAGTNSVTATDAATATDSAAATDAPTATDSPSSPDSTTTLPPSNTISLTTSTLYTTQIHTLISCPPHIPPASCPANPNTPILITETIALTTTICPISSSPTQLPHTTPVPIVPPVVICPGKGHACYPAEQKPSTTVKVPVAGETSKVPVVGGGVPSTTTKVWGTGAYYPTATATRGPVVTAGAGRVGMGMGVVVAGVVGVVVQGLF